MAITYKKMKTYTVPDGNDKVQYEIVDDAGRKMIAPDWYEHEDEAFAAGQHIVKDGILYRFLVPHTAGAEWNSAEVLTVTVAEDIAAIVTALNQRAYKVSGATANNIAALTANGDLKDSGYYVGTGSPSDSKLWSSQQTFSHMSNFLAMKADKVTGATENNFAALDANGNLKDSGKKPSDFITEHQDISGKADKVSGAVANNFAALDGNGNLKDSEKSASDFVASSDFTADKMPMSASDSTKVATAITELKSAIDGKASIIRDTVQNVAIASIPDGAANLPLTALKFKVEPIQSGSGDPYPAGGGKNKFPQQTVSGTQSVAVNNLDFPAGIYSFSAVATSDDTDDTSCAVIFFNGSTQVKKIAIARGTRKTALLEFESAVDNVIFYAATTNAKSAGDTFSFDDIQIESGSTATSYASYSNIRPITGRTGAVVAVTGGNVWDEEWVVGVIDNNGNYSSNGTRVVTENYVPVKPSTDYFPCGGVAWIFFYDSSKTFISKLNVNNNAFTTPENAEYLKFYTVNNYGSTYNDDISINYPSTDTTYHAYTGTQHTVQFGSTVYGASVDYVGGQADSDLALAVFVGSADEDWRINEYTNQNRVSILLNDAKAERDINVLANYLKAPSTFKSSPDEWEFNVNEYKYLLIGVPKTIDTVAKWKTYLASNNLQVLYHLDTPTTISLTVDEIRTVKGQNNVWADCGDIVELTYPCDTKGYIDKKLAELTALILENS